jgi:capsular exopolysaccharide synthesis family protein
VKQAGHAETTAGFPRLLDLRDINGTSAQVIPSVIVNECTDRRLVGHPEADPVYVEQYRRLGTALHYAQVRDGVRTVMVASALNRSFSKRVLLIDGDLRKPSVHQLLYLENRNGLSDMLKRPDAGFTEQALSPTLSVITSGHPDPDPVPLLVSGAAGQLLTDVRARFDWVVVDTPPVVLFPDAEILAGRLDRCVMVVNAATTAAPVAAQAVAAIGASRILGVVLNRAEPGEIAAGYGYGYDDYRDAGSGGGRRGMRRWGSEPQ